jgi:hypothetical protein
MKIRNFEENQTFSNIVTRIVTWGNLELEKMNKKNSIFHYVILLSKPIFRKKNFKILVLGYSIYLHILD